MSGSFEDLDVPPTLISFAVAVGNMKRATSPEFKDADHRIVRIAPRYLADGLTPDKDALLEVFSVIEELTDFHDALAVSTPGYGATAEALFKMTLGNRIGVTLNNSIAVDDLFTPAYGSFIVELADDAKLPAVSNLVEIGEIGTTTSEYVFKPPARRWTWTLCRKLGSPASNPCSRTVPRARTRARPSRPSTSTRRRRPCTSALPWPSRMW